MGAAVGKGGSNFLEALPSQGTFHVVMLGLDSAGKTTALYRLKFDQYLNTVPTIGFNCEKVQGTIGKAKGVQFLVWDVGGQEKLRPLWRSYTRCTDGILFVVDSVDVERMEEAKMELMRTAKCPDNQGVPVLILANKQDLPGARDAKELETLLGLHELIYPTMNLTSVGCSSSSTGNIVGCSKNNCSSSSNTYGRSMTPTSQHNKSFSYGMPVSCSNITRELNEEIQITENVEVDARGINEQNHILHKQDYENSSSVATTPTAAPCALLYSKKNISSFEFTHPVQYKGWYIQPTCAITGEGLQEGLEALYEMISKRRKLNKIYKKKR